MIIESIQLKNFRNYSLCEIALNPHINVFVGQNAQGKTNLLESVAFMSSTRSHRTAVDADMIKDGSEAAQISLVVNKEGRRFRLSGVIFKEGKQLLIQKQPVKRTSDFIGKLNAVIFSPIDLELFDGAPKLRRRFCDLEIGKTSGRYVQTLNQYQRTLKERNAYLKVGALDEEFLQVLTNRLVEMQCVLIAERARFIQHLNEFVSSDYQTISSTASCVNIVYLPPVEADSKMRESLLERYEQSLGRDRQFRQTHLGIHKDDLEFYLDGQTVRSHASQGQKRMVVLAMKTALIRYIRQVDQGYPVLLLDDVLSELDNERQIKLLDLIPANIQTIITTTNIENIKSHLPPTTRVFSIRHGEIIETEEITLC